MPLSNEECDAIADRLWILDDGSIAPNREYNRALIRAGAERAAPTVTPGAEPVAWRMRGRDAWFVRHTPPLDDADKEGWEPLYAAPQVARQEPPDDGWNLRNCRAVRVSISRSQCVLKPGHEDPHCTRFGDSFESAP